jgi:thiol-disulfide isomerase/thioredoxin
MVMSEEVKQSQWYYFYSQGCGFCKKSEPIVDELNKEGHDILKLDLAQGDNQKLNQELKKEYNLQCGTPWFINAETGKGICGYREKDIVEKWLDGEEIPAPPRPNGPPPMPPKDWNDEKEVQKWEEEYEKWRKENDHMPTLPDAKITGERLKLQQQRASQQGRQNGSYKDGVMNNRLQVLEGKMNILENKIDQIIEKLG